MHTSSFLNMATQVAYQGIMATWQDNFFTVSACMDIKVRDRPKYPNGAQAAQIQTEPNSICVQLMLDCQDMLRHTEYGALSDSQ